MARVEKQSDMEEKIQQVREDVVQKVKKRSGLRTPWLTCSLVLLVVVLGVLVWGVWMVAATGLVHVPVFTALAYEQPQPIREVSSGVPVETVLQETFTSTLTRRLYEGGGELQNRSIEAVVSEASLTASIRSLVEESDFTWAEVGSLQVVVDPAVGVEIFAPLETSVSDLETAIVSTFAIQATDGVIEVTPTSVDIGSFSVPDFVIATVLKPVLERELARVNNIVVGYARVSEIEIGSGVVTVKGELSVEIE